MPSEEEIREQFDHRSHPPVTSVDLDDPDEDPDEDPEDEVAE